MPIGPARRLPWLLARHADVQELGQRATFILALLLLLGGSVAWWALLPGIAEHWQLFAVFLTISFLGLTVYLLRDRSAPVAQALLVLGLPLILALALALTHSPIVPIFAVLGVVAAAAINPPLGFPSALLNTVVLLVFPVAGDLRAAAIAVLWLTALLEGISAQGLYSALEWAWSSQERASNLLEELRGRQGKLNQTLASLTEASRRLERTGYELAIARIRAEEARRLKEQFAANISHELRTPLNLILGFSEMMYLTPDLYGSLEWPVLLRRDVRRVYESSRQLLDLINDVLDLSRVDHVDMPIQAEPADLAETIQEAMETIRDLLRGRKVDLRAEVGSLPGLVFDRTRIRQVLLNLLSNAARFTCEGSITVQVQSNEREVIVSVTDTGAGIPPEELPRVFDEFYQVDMSLRRRQGGAGLGLAISRRFVELHGGRIWVESQVGKGSSFHFSLPLEAGGTVGHLTTTRPGVPQAAHSRPALVLVDPDPATGTLLDRYLDSYQVVQVHRPEQVRATVAEHHPRALIVNTAPGADWDPGPILDGLPAKLPVLQVSLPSSSWLSEQAGVRGVLQKPISREALQEAVRGLGDVRDVLVVDDDRAFVELASRLLESAGGGYRVHRAYEGAAALSFLGSRRIDLILLDVAMPEMDGLQVLAQLHAPSVAGGPPVILLTATNLGEETLVGRQGRVTLVRPRGFSVGEVIHHLQMLLPTTDVEYLAEGSPTP